MAINFPNSPSNGATHTAAGQTFTYDGTAGVWNPPASGNAAITTDGSTPSLATGITGAEVRTLIGAGTAAARTAVYANIAALPTSGTAGDMAYVTATNRLYLWTGTGWYNIALINTNPSISGVNATYNLAIDGSATTVTITASDPEGIPITYSIVSDTSGNTATVAQGTGASTNVFTITPSTNTAHAGTFSLTFRASDGVNIASSAASFTLQFTVQNQRYTTALITSVGANNAVNTTFDDKSTSDHTITANGDAHQTTFSPYRHGGYSAYFDGTGDSLQLTTSGDLQAIGRTGATCTMECWVWLESVSSNGTAMYSQGTAGSTGGNNVISFGIKSDRKVRGLVNGSFTSETGCPISTGTVPLRTWTHLALVLNSNTWTIYINGTADGTATGSYPSGTTHSTAYIGRIYYEAARTGEMYIRDLRITNTAVYTSNFTAPTEPLTAISGTKLLTCHLPYIADASSTSYAITVNGDASTKPFAPFDAQEYAAADHGGSLHSDGNGDYLAVAASSDFDLGTSDFTIEGWVYPTAYGNANFILGQNYFSSIIQINSGKLQFYSSPASAYIITAATDIALNVWTHWAVVRNGNAWAIYLNGKSDATVTNAADAGYDSTNPLHIMRWNNSNSTLAGTLADLRVVKGTAVYSANFTPPTAPLAAITNTSLLVQSTDAGIIDKAQTPRFVKLLGNTKSSTTQTKFLSSSMYFDGTGDYIEADDQDIGNFGSGDFTAEGWFYLTASPSNYITIAETRGSGASTTGWVMAISAGDFYVYSGALIGAKGSAISSNTWYHWAFTRSGTDQKVFLNGTQTGTTYTTVRNYTDNNFTIGAKHDASEFFTGYQSDVRITKGLARYTADFTAPTAALKG